MIAALSRRLERLERALVPEQSGPCFVMAPDRITADREVLKKTPLPLPPSPQQNTRACSVVSPVKA